MKPSLKTIPINQIHNTHANLRHETDTGLDGLAASLGTEAEPSLVQPPIIEQIEESEYTIVAGERRIRAARKAGWGTIACIVYPRLDPLHAHTLRLVENLHRRDLHPLDEAAALKISWLSANAEGMGLGDQARTLLRQDAPPTQTLANLQSLLEKNGFTPNHPVVPWEALLAQLGLDLDPERRKKLLGVLNVDGCLQEQVRSLDVTEAALRSIGTLEAEDQRRLVQEVANDPKLARKIRRIARVVRDGTYTLDEALAEARGQVAGIPLDDLSTAPPMPEVATAIHGTDDALPDDRPMATAMQLLEIANRLSTTLATLSEVSHGDLALLPQPWGEYAREAIDLIRAEIDKFDHPD